MWNVHDQGKILEHGIIDAQKLKGKPGSVASAMIKCRGVEQIVRGSINDGRIFESCVDLRA